MLVLREILRLAQAHGIATGPALDAAGVDAAPVEAGAGHLPVPALEAAINALLDDARGKATPVELALQTKPGTFGIVSFLAMVAPTLGDIVDRAIEYERLLGDFGSTSRREQNGYLRIDWHCGFASPRARRAMTEGVIAAWVVYARWLANDPAWCPVRVYMAHGEPQRAGEREAWSALFGAPVQFDQPASGLLLRPAFLATPLRAPDPVLFATLDTHARTRLATAQRREGFDGRVRQAIRARIDAGQVPRRDEIAAQLAMNPRTMLRRLEEGGLTFQTLLDETRREIALALAEDPRLDLATLAARAGFGDARSLQRAFRQWTGSSLREFRTRRAFS